MAKKKKGEARRRQKSLADVKKKGEVVFKFAYSLYTGPKGTGSERAVKQLLALRRKELPGESLGMGSGLLFKYRKLIIDGSEAFESLPLVLMGAAEDSTLRIKVLDILIKEFASDIGRGLKLIRMADTDRNMMDRELDDPMFVFSAAREREAKLFYRTLSAGWAALSEYVEMLDAWDYVSKKSEEHVEPSPLIEGGDAMRMTIKAVEETVSIIDRRDKETDAELLDSYSNDTSYFKTVMQVVMETFSELGQRDARVYIAKLAFDRALAQCQLYAQRAGSLKADVKELQARSLRQIESDESASIDEISAPKEMLLEDWCMEKVWTTNALNALRGECLLSGIDIVAIAGVVNFPAKEARPVVKKAFALYDIRYEAETGASDGCPYTKEADKIAVIELIVRLWAQELISKQIQVLLDEKRLSKGRSESKELSEAKALIGRLKEENNRLRVRPLASNQKKGEAEKKKDAEIKDLRAKLHELEASLNKERERAESLERENKDIRSIFELEMEEDASSSEVENSGVTEDFFKEYIKENRVLVWGLRASTEQRYSELYPELSFASSDRKLTRKQLEYYDVFIMCTSNTNHANYWSARDTAKALGINMAYLAKSMNDPKHLWWALGIALGERDAA